MQVMATSCEKRFCFRCAACAYAQVFALLDKASCSYLSVPQMKEYVLESVSALASTSSILHCACVLAMLPAPPLAGRLLARHLATTFCFAPGADNRGCPLRTSPRN